MPLDANPATAHMFIIKPFSGAGLLGLFSTHPPTEARIEALRAALCRRLLQSRARRRSRSDNSRSLRIAYRAQSPARACGPVAGLHLALLPFGRRAAVHVDDLDISPSKIGETAQRIRRPRDRRGGSPRTRAADQRAHLPRLRAGRMGHVRGVMHDIELNPHTILQAIEEHLHVLPSFAGRDLRVSPATKLVFKLALHHASRAGRQAIEAADLFSAVFEETQGVPVSILRRHGVEPEVLVSRLQTPDARHGASRGAAEEALRAAAVPEALCDQSEPAGAAGQAAAGVRPRRRNSAGARNPLPPRARQLGDARRRARRRQDGDRRGPGAPHRVRARHRAGPAARLPDRQPADELDGRRHDAARHVRGPHSERDPRAEGASEPDSVRRRGAHDGRRRLGAWRARRMRPTSSSRCWRAAKSG